MSQAIINKLDVINYSDEEPEFEVDSQSNLYGSSIKTHSRDDSQSVNSETLKLSIGERPMRFGDKLEGTLLKWTNYMHGWQERYVVLENGLLTYFVDKNQSEIGCKGSVTLSRATFILNEQDDCRFDIIAGSLVYFFRCSSQEERKQWIDHLEAIKTERRGSQTFPGDISSFSVKSFNSGSVHSSCFSVTANKLGLKERLLEIDTLKDMLSKQIDNLQNYYDILAQCLSNPTRDIDLGMDDISDEYMNDTNYNLNEVHEAKLSDPPRINEENNLENVRKMIEQQNIDFRGEAISFRSTTSGIISTLNHCVDIIDGRERSWRRVLQLEKDKRRSILDKYNNLVKLFNKKCLTVNGPDCEEGPNCVLNDDEFFDALETAFSIENNKSNLKSDSIPAGNSINVEVQPQIEQNDVTIISGQIKDNETLNLEKNDSMPFNIFLETKMNQSYSKACESIKFLLDICLVDAKKVSGWVPCFEDQYTTAFRSHHELDGFECDPIKIFHVVPNVTAAEVADHFYCLDVRLKWEVMIEKLNIIESHGNNMTVVHQIHKRVWPSSQRDLCYLSHRIDNFSHDYSPLNETFKKSVECLRETGSKFLLQKGLTPSNVALPVGEPKLVFNYSVDHESAPVTSNYIRAKINVILLAQTFAIMSNSGEQPSEINSKRPELFTCFFYNSFTNLGGWVPHSVIIAVGKREYHRFLQRFSKSAINHYDSSEPMWSRVD